LQATLKKHQGNAGVTYECDGVRPENALLGNVSFARIPQTLLQGSILDSKFLPSLVVVETAATSIPMLSSPLLLLWLLQPLPWLLSLLHALAKLFEIEETHRSNEGSSMLRCR